MILFKIAVRNLREHKIKTLIIGSLIALSIALLVIGNSVAQTLTNSMGASFKENFTGDIILRYGGQNNDLDATFNGNYANNPVLRNFQDISDFLAKQDYIEAFTPLLTGSGEISNEQKTLESTLLWAAPIETYRNLFANSSFKILEGRDLVDGERGIVVAKNVLDDILKTEDTQLKVGDIIKLNNSNDFTGLKIREVPIVGIGEYTNSVGIVKNISFVDVTTLRALLGLTEYRSEQEANNSVNPDKTSLVETSSQSDISFDDSLFASEESSLVEDGTTTEALDIYNVLGDTSIREELLSIDNNAWNFFIVKLKKGSSAKQVTKELTKLSQASDSSFASGLVVEDWEFGAGQRVVMVGILATLFNIFIVIIGVISIIIIMNTLVISVTERIPEIGTIRAIGGQKYFVRSMITLEIFIITLIFGIVGIVVGTGLLGVINLFGIEAPNDFFNTLFGGEILKPSLSLGSVLLSLIAMIIVGIVASFYPVSVALGISPVRAMDQR